MFVYLVNFLYKHSPVITRFAFKFKPFAQSPYVIMYKQCDDLNLVLKFKDFNSQTPS